MFPSVDLWWTRNINFTFNTKCPYSGCTEHNNYPCGILMLHLWRLHSTRASSHDWSPWMLNKDWKDATLRRLTWLHWRYRSFWRESVMSQFVWSVLGWRKLHIVWCNLARPLPCKLHCYWNTKFVLCLKKLHDSWLAQFKSQSLFFNFYPIRRKSVILYVKVTIYYSSADFSDWYRLKCQARKAFDVILCTESVSEIYALLEFYPD